MPRSAGLNCLVLIPNALRDEPIGPRTGPQKQFYHFLPRGGTVTVPSADRSRGKRDATPREMSRAAWAADDFPSVFGTHA